MGRGGCCAVTTGGPARQLDLYGPPGTGKGMTLAQVIANTTRPLYRSQRPCSPASRRSAGRWRSSTGAEHYSQRTILLSTRCTVSPKRSRTRRCPGENGTVIFIGATTENPTEVNKALVSRSRIFQLTPLDGDDLRHRAPGIEDKSAVSGNP